MSRSRALCFVLMLCACASQPEYASFKGISPVSAIAVESFAGITESGPPDSKVGELAGQGAAIGALAGMEAGMEVGNQLTGDCGVFIVVCLALAPAFGAAAMTGGVIVGSIAGLSEDMSYESTEAMQEVISGYFEDASPNLVFRQVFIEKASAGWTIDPDADTKVTVAVIGIRPKKARGNTLGFVVTTAMSVRYAAAEANTKPFQLTTVTAAYGIDEWIDGGLVLYSSEVEKVFAQSARAFTALLRQPPR